MFCNLPIDVEIIIWKIVFKDIINELKDSIQFGTIRSNRFSKNRLYGCICIFTKNNIFVLFETHHPLRYFVYNGCSTIIY